MAAMSVCLATCSNSPQCIAECAAVFATKVVEPDHVLGAFGLLVLSGLFSGLTLGLDVARHPAA